MRHTRFVAVFSFLLFCLGISIAANAADFTLSATSASFSSTVINTTSLPKTLTLTNTSGAALSFTESTAAPFGATDACGGSVAAGAKCTISITFSPTATGLFGGTLTVAGGTTSVNVTLSGTGVLATSVSPTTLSFGYVVINVPSAAKTFKLTNNQTVPLNSIAIGSSNPDFVVTGCPASLAAKQSCTASVIFTPSSLTSESATLTVTNDAPSTGQTVSATGKGVQPITLSTASVTFSTTILGATSPIKTITLKNNQTFPLNSLSIITSPASEFSATGCAPPLAALTSCVINLTFSPASAVPTLRTGTVTVNTPDAANAPIFANLKGTAGLPVTASPSPVKFSSVTVGSTSAVHAVTITNKQAVDLHFGGTPFQTTGDFAVSSTPTLTPCGATLAPLAACSINLTATPSFGGTSNGTLIISDDAVGSPQQILLTVNGKTPVTVSPISVSFGQIAVGLASAAKIVTLQNNQAGPVTISGRSITGDFQIFDTTCGTTLAVDASCTITLKATPTLAGSAKGSLTVTDDTTGSPHVVPLTAYGVNAVTETPNSLKFSTQQIGTTSISKQITIVNHEMTQEVPFSVAITGEFATTNNCMDALGNSKLSPGGSCVLSFTFTPTGAGTRSGSAVIHYNANGVNASVSASLSGTGSTTPLPASVASVAPGAGELGTQVDVIIEGFNTHFSNSSVVSFDPIIVNNVSTPSGITVSNVVAQPDGTLAAHLAIDGGTVPGPRNIKVVTPLTGGGTETAKMVSAFVVSAQAGLAITSITPASAPAGWTGNVDLIAGGTHFAQGVTLANFGNGIVVNGPVQVVSDTEAIANITLSNTAAVGLRTVTLVTNGEFAVSGDPSAPGFTVNPNSASLVSVNPNTGVQGTNVVGITITGSNSHFQQNATLVSFGGGINVGNTVVTDATHLTVDVAITGAAAVGLRDVTVSTGGEILNLPSSFSVTGGTAPYLASVSPSVGTQGQTLDVSITSAYTDFIANPPTLTFGSNITVNQIGNVTATSLTANISIATFATAGGRTAILTSGGTDFPFSFTVQSAALGLSFTPSAGLQGQSLTLHATGINTHWDQATTTAWFSYYPYCAVPTVNRTTVNSATSADVDITIPFGGCVGGLTFNMANGGEQVANTFTVVADTPSLTVSPGSAKIGQTVTVNFTGEFTHFADSSNANPTTAIIDGTGISFVPGSFNVTGPTSATAKFVIAPDAPVNPPVWHTITLTTPLGSGKNEIVTTTFSATNTPAVLTDIEPYHAIQGASLLVDIYGANTHFDGTTTVGFGPNITVGTPNVLDSGHIQVNIQIEAGAAIGWRNAYVNTGSEQLTIGFRVDDDNPVLPALAVNVQPSSGAQGQALPVNIVGQNTHWVQGTTEAIVGAGITVSNLQVQDATHATATIAISPTAPVGGNSVIMITGTEIASGTGFSVTRGIAQITHVTPGSGAQNQTLFLDLVGNGTHWLQGGSSLDIGTGIHIDSLTIQDATHAHVQVTVLSTATVGLHDVTMFTDGEYATLVQGFNVVQATPALLSSYPNSGAQATTFDVQVLGRYTHWVNGVTTASYGDGIVVNSVNVLDSDTAVVNVTVSPFAYLDIPCIGRTLIVTTNTEQVALPYQFCVTKGAAVVTNVNPNAIQAGNTVTVQVTGQNTHFVAGLTNANFGPGINSGNVVVNSPTSATVDIAVPSTATNGFHPVTMTTLGESASLDQGFTVGPTTPTLNGVSPYFGQQGESLTLHIIGQYTHFQGGVTTATFGQGITLNNLTVTSTTSVDADVTIDPLTYTGGRTITVTTNGEIVSGNLFSVVSGPAIISQVAPTTGNQGQEIVLSLTGQSTHWAQGFTQFSMPGLGSDIHVNYFVINSPTSATADITISPTAGLGPRSIYMVTGGEALVDSSVFVVTGGIPSITSVNPSHGLPGDSSVNVQISGVYTQWDNTSTVDFGPGIAIQTYTVNNNTSITAVINVDPAAQIGYRTVTVRTGTQALTSSYHVDDPTVVTPTPYISWMSPGSGLPGQTFTITFAGQFTNWDPGSTTILFGTGSSGITVNSFQVLSPTSARANITIDPSATQGSRRVEITTGTELEVAYFSVVYAVPSLSIVDPSSAMQGATLDVNVIGQYTTFNNTTTFAFGPGITLNSVNILGPTIATVNVTVDQLAQLGGHGFSVTTGSQVVYGTFYVTASQATVTGVSPNTAKQGDTLTVTVAGQNTHWDYSTTFSFGGGITVNSVNVTSATSADVNISIAPLAYIGAYSVNAQTQGEIAHMTSAFVVQAGTPLILSSGPSSGQQQQNVNLTVLGQFSGWIQGNTTVDVGPGITVNSINVTSTESMTVGITVQPLAYIGYRNLTTVTTTGSGPQVLSLQNAFYVTQGPAAISLLNPDNGDQGHTLDVGITGTNTHFINGTTTASFGPGITTNSVTVTDATHATANITIAAYAQAGFRTVTAITYGESASLANGFTVNAASPVINFVNPSTGAQGETKAVTVYAQFTNFNNTTVFSFGSGVTVNSAAIVNSTQATVNITVSPTTATGYRNVSATTGSEIASLQNGFQVTAGPAYISSVTPNFGRQNQTGLVLTISGNGTHFTAGTPSVDLGPGVTPTNIQVLSDTNLKATVNISQTAPVQLNNVNVTTLSEVASLTGGFRVLTGDPVVTSVSPNTAHQADSLDVVVYALYTHFAQGQTSADFGSGITVNSVAVNSSTQATVNITVDPAASAGARTVTMSTNRVVNGNPVVETAQGVGLFSVLAGTPQITSISPNTGAQGSTQTMTITGLFTHFQAGVSQVSFSGSGVTVGTVTVNGPTQIQVPVTVTYGSTPGTRTVTVTTNAESVSLLNGFTVQQGQPTITSLSTNVGVPNSTLNVTINGQFTNFSNGVTQANFGAGISVNGGPLGGFGTVQVTSATTAIAALSIDAAATLGPRNVTVQTNAESISITNGFTVQSTSTTAPTVAAIFPVSGAGGVPLNTEINLQFTAPIDRTTVSTLNVRLTDNTTMGWCNYQNYTGGIPATVSVDASGRIITLVPSTVLAVGHLHYVCLNYGQSSTANAIKDPGGHEIGATYFYFTTGFTPDNSGPAFVVANIADGDNTVPTNAPVRLKFTKPINAITQPNGITVQQGGNNVPGNWGYSTDYRIAIFTPASPFAASTPYTVNITSALEDLPGNSLTNPTSISFTTGTGPDNNYPAFVNYTPVGGETVGRTPQIRAVFNKPIDPVYVDPGYGQLYDNTLGRYEPGVNMTYSTDRLSATLTLPRPLQPNNSYTWYMYPVDRVGHESSGGVNFYTSNAPDATGPAVLSVSPPDGATGVPVNTKIQAVLNEQLDRTVGPTVTINPTVAFTYAMASDNQTLIFTPNTNLATSTLYTVTLSGMLDGSGNPMAPFSWSFTTSASSTPDNSNGNITSATPSNGATNVPLNTTVVVNFSKPVNPGTVHGDSTLVLYDTVTGDFQPVGVNISSDDMTVTLTPTTQLVNFRQYCVYMGNWGYVYDWTGHNFNYTSWCFTTAYSLTPDATPPTVVSVTPVNGATNIGPLNPVTVTFSKPMTRSSVQAATTLYIGSSLYAINPTVSQDGTTATFNPTLPYNTKFTVVVDPSASDVSGNLLGTQFRSTFTTGIRPNTYRPQVTQFRPGAGANNVDPNTPLTFLVNGPMDASTVGPNLYVSSNGVLITGTTTVTDNNQVITFTPSAPLQLGAYVQVWLTSGATDTFGNAFYDYQTSFSVVPDQSLTQPVVSQWLTPCCSGLPTNTVVDVLFNKPINGATATSSAFYLTDNGGNPVSATISQPAPNMLRLTPNSPLAPGYCYWRYYVTSALKDVNALGVTPNNYYFCTGSSPDTVQPVVAAFAPTDGSTGIGVNATIRVLFNKAIVPATITPTSLTISANGNAIPYIVSAAQFGSWYDSNTYAVYLVPEAPLPASSQVTVSVTSGVTDNVGQGVTPASATFTTAGGADFSQPTIIRSSITSGDANVPVNSSFTFAFDRPMDTRSFLSQYIYLWDYQSGGRVPITISLNVDGSVMTLTPNSALAVNRNYYFSICYPYDLTGNYLNCSNYNFTTALYAQPGGPQVVRTTVYDGQVNVPGNFSPTVQFDRPIAHESVNNINLTINGVPVAVNRSFDYADTVVVLTPQVLLQPNTTYVFSISGATDIAGNAMAGVVTRQFTTGGGTDHFAPSVVSATPINGTTVSTNPVIQLLFNEPIDPLRSFSGWYLYNNTISNYVRGTAITVGADQKSATFTYPGSLDPGTYYSMCSGTFYDLAGYNSSYCFGFYTASAPDAAGPTVVLMNPQAGSTGSPVNPSIDFTLNEPINPNSWNPAGITLTSAAGAPSTINLSTGLNASGLVQYGNGNTDANWTTTAIGTSTVIPASVVAPGGPDWYGGWKANGTASSWIARDATIPNQGNASFSFTRTFSLTNYNLATVSLAGTWAVDDTGVIVLNGTQIATLSGGNWGNLQPFSVAQGSPLFLQGTNTLTIVVTSSDNYLEGVRLEAAVSGTTGAINGAASVPGIATRDGSNQTFHFVPSVPLAPNTTYSLNVAANAYSDEAGNIAVPFAGSFTTGGFADFSAGSITLSSPASGAIGVPLNSSITATFSKPVNRLYVTPATFRVFPNNNSNLEIAGTIAIAADGLSITFTPISPLAPNTTYWVGVGNYANLYDLTDRNFNGLYASFTTGGGTLDTTPPSVTSITPTDATPNVGPLAPITLVFSKSINQAYMNQSYFTVYNGFSQIGVSVNYSSDHHIVTLTGTWPYGSTLTVAVSSDIQDVYGVPMGTPFYSTFSTIPYELRNNPNITATRPGASAANVPTANPITLYTSAPVNPSTVSSGLAVAQNGVVISGSATLTPDGHAITWTPSVPYTRGAYVQVFINGNLTDTQGNPFNSYSTQFTVVPDLTTTVPSVTAWYPNCCGATPTNTIVEVAFNKPIDSATVNSSTFYVLQNNGGSPIAGTISQPQPNVLRFTPTSPLAASVCYFYIHLTTGLKDTDGNPYPSNNYNYFCTGASADNSSPAVTSVSPYDGATNIGDNARIRITFNKFMANDSFHSSSVTLMNGATPIPYTASFDNNFLNQGATTVYLYPLTPLPHNAAITVALTADVTDTVGHGITAQSFTFNTGNGIDFSAPVLVSKSVVVDGINVPSNSPVTYTFDEPLDSAFFTTGYASIYQYGVGYIGFTMTLGSDQRTVTLTPASPFSPGTQYQTCVYVYDLLGNGYTGTCSSFYGGAADSTAPTVIGTSPVVNATGVPTNAVIDVTFDELIRNNSLTASTVSLSTSGGNVPIATAYVIWGGAVVRIVPASLLQPNTTYTVTLNGVQDIAGNPLAASYSYSFTTGPNFSNGGYSYLNATITAGGVDTQLVSYNNVNNASTGTSITLAFNAAVDVGSLLYNSGAVLRVNGSSTNLPFTVSLSADGKTATLTPTSPLTNGTQYLLYVNYLGSVFDQTGRNFGNGYYYYFTTN